MSFVYLEDAISYVKRKQESPEGAVCPCCKRLNKVYTRKLHSGMVLALIYIYKLTVKNGGDWIHITDDFVKNFKIDAAKLDYNKLAYFGFIRKKVQKVEGKRDSGYWKLTNKGRDFIKNRIFAPTHVKLINGDVVGFSNKHIFAKECLGVKFDYDELMGL